VNRTSEYRLLLAGVVACCSAAATGAVVPAVERALDATALVALALAAGWIAVAAVRRELRIRRRLAAISPPPGRPADPSTPSRRVDTRGVT
jgi:hypothetical protein